MRLRSRLLSFCSAMVLGCLMLASAEAQTIRFDTNVGTFDMELNPTGNPGLQPYVDNLLAYVESGRYDLTVINRAADGVAGDRSDDFVLQMGGFQATTLTAPANCAELPAVPSFDNLIQDADGDNIVDIGSSADTGLLNRRGTVAIALSNVDGNPANPEDVNSGTREFFINVGTDNTFLDTDGTPGNFVPFAEVTDMATVDLIMGLAQMPITGATDLPVLDGNRLVFIERAFVLESTANEALAMMSSAVEDLGSTGSIDLTGIGESLVASSAAISASPTAAMQTLTVPEPPAFVLALGALVMIYIMKPSKKG